MSNKIKKQVVLPFPVVTNVEQSEKDDALHNQVRPKAQQYADRTWAPPRGTRRSMGKR